MKILQHNNGIVVDVFNARPDVTSESLIVVDEIPAHEPKKGFNGILKYNGNNVYWDYEEVKIVEEISSEEFYNMVEEVL